MHAQELPALGIRVKAVAENVDSFALYGRLLFWMPVGIAHRADRLCATTHLLCVAVD
jgi:hypothetical protein